MSSETEQREAENDQLALDDRWIRLRIVFLKKRIEKIQKAQREAAQFKSWEERVAAGQNSRK